MPLGVGLRDDDVQLACEVPTRPVHQQTLQMLRMMTAVVEVEEDDSRIRVARPAPHRSPSRLTLVGITLAAAL
jgi:hypothetical protein